MKEKLFLRGKGRLMRPQCSHIFQKHLCITGVSVAHLDLGSTFQNASLFSVTQQKAQAVALTMSSGTTPHPSSP